MAMRLTKRRRAQGLTLVELLVAVTVLGILLGVAIPAFRKSINQNRLSTQTNEFITTLAVARSEAIKRGGNVVVSKTGTYWEAGWSVYYDADESNSFNDDGDATACEPTEDCYLIQQSALAGGTTVRVASGANYANYVRYNAVGGVTGSATGGSKEFRICGNDGNSARGRSITLEPSGYVRTAKGVSSCS